MNKNMIAMAILGTFAAAASAQSSVTVYGSVDLGVRRVTDSGSANAAGSLGTKTSIGSSGNYNSSRLGFRGVEDLGDGMNAHFNLESGFNAGTGALNNTLSQLFDRMSYVGIDSKFGTVDLGRQLSIAFRIAYLYDPLNYKFPAISPNVVLPAGSQGTPANPLGYGSTRFNNDLSYSKEFGPLTLRAEYAPGEATGSNANGSAAATGASYVYGPVTFGAAYTRRKTDGVLHTAGNSFANTINLAGSSAIPFDQSNTQWTTGVSYQANGIRVALGYMNEKQVLRAGGDLSTQNLWTGASYLFNPFVEVTAAYYQTKASGPVEGTRSWSILGATYYLSKRTNLYAEIDRNKFAGGLVGYYAPLGVDKQIGMSVGLNHTF